MITVLVSYELPSPASTVWETVGDPASMASWHPAIAKSRCDGTDRRCLLPDGAEVHEQIHRVNHAERTYEYSILKAPIPIRDHRSTFRVKELDPTRSVVEWMATFEAADGVPGAQLAAGMRDMFALGLDALRARFGPPS